MAKAVELEPLGGGPSIEEVRSATEGTVGGAVRSATSRASAGEGTDIDVNYFPDPGTASVPTPGSFMDAEGEYERARDMYGEPEQDDLMDRGEGYYDKYLEGARSPSQQAANYPYQFMNLAKQNPRGNLNGASFRQTLRFSRLADMLNNRLRYVPSPQVAIGTPQTGYQVDGGADISKYPEIETEEMRLMQANREMDRRARQAGVDLQSRIQAYPQDMQELRDKTLVGFGNDLLSSENEFSRFMQRAMVQSEYMGSVRQFFEKDMKQFLVDVRLHTNAKLANFMLNELAPMAAQFLADVSGLGVSVPERDVRFVWAVKDFIWGSNIGYKEKVAAFSAICLEVGIDAGAVAFKMFRNVLPLQTLRDIADTYRSLSDIRSLSGPRN